jgi:pectin methylesterase-like acyl-CoA thioesterase
MNCASFSRLAVAALVGFAFMGNLARAETAAFVAQPPTTASPPAPSSNEAKATGAAGEVMRLAQAASAGFASDTRSDRPKQAEKFVEPPALLIYLAGLVVIVFVTTRRRRDDN